MAWTCVDHRERLFDLLVAEAARLGTSVKTCEFMFFSNTGISIMLFEK
jgi:hypothetical protein